MIRDFIKDVKRIHDPILNAQRMPHLVNGAREAIKAALLLAAVFENTLHWFRREALIV
jgi:hypothetical protein